MTEFPHNPLQKHSYHRRANFHDYHTPCIYHIILKKSAGSEAFGRIVGDARIKPGEEGCARTEWSSLGKIIARAIYNIQFEFPILQLYQYQIMPDHLHILLRIKQYSEQPLGYYIANLKRNIARTYGATSAEQIFEPNYCDKPLFPSRSLNSLFQYIRENPHRLAMRKQYPHFFQRVRGVKIGDNDYEAYGNFFLLGNPDKLAVKISRHFTDEEINKKRNLWISEATRGTILVSPFISPREKSIREEAEKRGAKIILLVHEALSERYKPAAHDFGLCSEGRLLIISLGQPAKTHLSRQMCVDMNNLAAQLAKL